MKKITALLSGLILSLGIGATCASAEGEFLDYRPQIVYNAEVTAIEDVRMTDGRVFVPLRAVFEMMGATVDYSNETTMITVVRDNTKVEFLREGTSMTITDLTGVNPVKVIDAEIKCDFQIERTFVPVRFISNALGARVGWDGESGTVLILDSYTLANEFAEKNTNLAEFIKRTAFLDENVKSNLDAELKFNFNNSWEQKTVSGDLKANLTESEFDSKSTYGLKLDFTHKGLENLTGGYKIGNAEGIEVNVLKNEEAIYFSTNAAEKIATILPEETDLHIAKSVVTPNTWFRIDYSFVEERFGKEIADAIYKDIKPDAQNFDEKALMKEIATAVAVALCGGEDDVTYEQMLAAKVAFDAYNQIFSKLTFEDTADGGFIVKMSYNVDDVLKLIPKNSFATEEEYNMAVEMVRNMVTLNFNLTDKIVNNIEAETTADFDLGMDIMGVSVDVEFKLSGKAEKLNKAPEFKVPEKSLSIDTVFTLLDM